MKHMRVLWHRLGIREKVAAILLVVLTPLLAAIIIHVALVDHLRSVQDQHHHVMLAREQLHILRRLAVDIEDGFRGYLLTGQDVFLTPMKEAEARLQPTLDAIDSLGVAAIQGATAEIRQHLQGLLNSKHELLQRVQTDHLNDVLEYVRSGQGIALSDDLKTQFRLLEDRLVRQLSNMETDELWMARLAFEGLIGAVVAVLVLGYLAVRLFGESIIGPVTALQRSVKTWGADPAEKARLELVARDSSDEIAQLAGSYLEMVGRITQHIRELEALSAISHEMNVIGPDGLEGVLRRITNHAAELLQVDLCLVMLRNDQMGCWIVEAASGDWFERLNKSVMLWEEFPLSVQAFESKQPVVGEDLRRDQNPEMMRRNLFGQSMLSIPLLSQGIAFGVLVLLQERKVTREEWNMTLATGFADEAAMALSNARLYEATSRKGRHVEARIHELQHLAENLAHDMKGPGERIEGLASLLRADRGSELSEEGIHWLTLIDFYGKEIRQRVEHILSLAKVGSQSTAIEAVDPAIVIQHVLKVREAEIEQSRVRVEVQKDLPMVACHSAYLRQVFDNLISNAIKYSSRRTNPHISITCERKGEQIYFTVCDNGRGIPPHDHERIFAPFVRLNPEEAPGSGIGLTIVRRIIELYGGRIWVDSQVGEGCSIIFSIPALANLGPPMFHGEPPKWTYGAF